MQQLSLSRIAVEYIYHICPKLLGGSVTFTSGTELAHSTDSQQVAVPKCAICTKSVQEMWKFHSKKERKRNSTYIRTCELVCPVRVDWQQRCASVHGWISLALFFFLKKNLQYGLLSEIATVRVGRVDPWGRCPCAFLAILLRNPMGL